MWFLSKLSLLQYQFDGSFLEIYNETIRDLLGNGKDDVKHDIKMTGNASNDVMVTNLTVLPVTSPEKVSTKVDWDLFRKQ